MQVLFFLLQLSVVGEREKCTVDPRIPKVSIVFIPVGEWCVCVKEKNVLLFRGDLSGGTIAIHIALPNILHIGLLHIRISQFLYFSSSFWGRGMRMSEFLVKANTVEENKLGHTKKKLHLKIHHDIKRQYTGFDIIMIIYLAPQKKSTLQKRVK